MSRPEFIKHLKAIGSLIAKKNLSLNFGNSGTLARLIIGILSIQFGFGQKKIEIISSNFDQLVIEVNTKLITAEDLKPFDILIGLPSKTLPNIQLESKKEAQIEKMKIREIARTEWLREGSIPSHTLRADIDYAEAEALTTYGIIGIKVWIYKGEVFAREFSQETNKITPKEGKE